MKTFFYYIFLLNFSICVAQNTKIYAKEINSVAFIADYFVGFDNFENYFYVKDNILFKKKKSDFLQYQNLSLGKLTKVDITNPLKIVLFYKEFNSVIIVDNQLNEIQKIDFSTNEIPIVASAIGISGQNQLWVYNSLNQQIGLYDLTTTVYKNLGVPIKENFSYYQTDFNYFYWIDSQNQWMCSTIFGRVLSVSKLDLYDKIQIIDGNTIVYLKNNQLYFKDLMKSTSFEIEIVEKSFKNFYYKDQILSIFTDHGITNYKIIIP